MRLELDDEFYGIKVEFNYEPVKGLPLKTFVFKGHELIVFLAQSWQRIYEMQLSVLEFTEPCGFPLKACSPHEWLDMAQLLKQGKYKPGVNPLLAMDIGGRKIVSAIPSDRYSYDKGELPAYAARMGIPGANEDNNRKGIILLQNPDDAKVVTDPNEVGANPVYAPAEKDGNKSERISYREFYLLLEAHYGPQMDSSLIAKECRRVLSGELLNPRHAPVIPLMMGSMFVSEVSRNRACLVTGMMLMDLIESQVPAAGIPGEFYSFRNSLWAPEMYPFTAAECKKDPVKKRLTKIGGFHPMAHLGSWEKEFKEDGPYQGDIELTTSHIKSKLILIEWLRHSRHPLLENITITKLNKVEYENEEAICKMQHESLSKKLQCKNTFSGTKNSVLLGFLFPLINERFASFRCMLPTPHDLELNNSPDSDRKRNIFILNHDADLLLADQVRQSKLRYEVRMRDLHKIPELSSEIQKRIETEVGQTETALALFKEYDPRFKLEKWEYYLKNNPIPIEKLASLFITLHSLEEPSHLRLSNILLNANNMELISVYKIIFTCPKLFKRFSASCKSYSDFIRLLSDQLPIRKELINLLLEDGNNWFLEKCSGAEIFDIIESSQYFFSRILIEKPDLFRKLQASTPLYKIIEKIYHLKNGGSYFPNPEQWKVIVSHNYAEEINAFVRPEERLPLVLPPVANQHAFFNPLPPKDKEEEINDTSSEDLSFEY